MDIGHILSNTPPIVENIFIYLNKEELDACSQVCQLWGSIAETEKNRREDIAWFFQGLHCSLHDKIHSNPNECPLDNTRDIEKDLSLQLKDLKLKPYFCLAFASDDFLQEFEKLFQSFVYPPSPQAKRLKQEDLIRKRAYLKAAVFTALRQYLPEQCKTTFCVASGIIGCQGDLIPIEIEEGCGISGIVLPQVPGLQVFNFATDERNCNISHLIPKDTSIKCLLVFITMNQTSTFNKIIQNCLLRESAQIAIGGAIIERSESRRGSVVAFCGRSVEAASIIISRQDRESELEKKLKLFEETGLLKNRCFAFMFACVARGHVIHRQYNLESSIFHKLYPNVPLIGVFGNGEIGVNYLPNIAKMNRNDVLRIGKLVKSRKKFLYSYTTIFVLVSVKM